VKISSWLWNSPPRKIAFRCEYTACLSSASGAPHESKVPSHNHARQPPKYEIVEAGVVGRRFEAQRAGGSSQSDFDRFGGLDRQVRIADIECAGRIMRAAREQFGRFRCALDILRRDTGDQIPRKILDQANAAAFWCERQISRDAHFADFRRAESPPENLALIRADRHARCGRQFGLGRVGEFELVEDIACFIGCCGSGPTTIEERAWIVRLGAVSS